jgi:hypothetical protein
LLVHGAERVDRLCPNLVESVAQIGTILFN